MKKIKLDKEEKAIEAAIERGEYVPVTGKKLQEIIDAITQKKKDIRNR